MYFSDTRSNAGHYYGYYYASHYRYTCSDSHRNLSECTEYNYRNRYYEYSLGVKCATGNVYLNDMGADLL